MIYILKQISVRYLRIKLLKERMLKNIKLLRIISLTLDIVSPRSM